MLKNLKNIIREFKNNKNSFVSSARSAAFAFAKMLLINRLERIKFFRPMVIITKTFLKWSAYTSIFSVGYSVVCKIFHFQYDLAFWFGLAYGIWLIVSEGLIDYIFEAYTNLDNKAKSLVYNIYNKFSSNPQTVEKANKIKSNVKLHEIIEKFNEEEHRKFQEREAIRLAELENKRLEDLDKLRKEREAIRLAELENKHSDE